MQDALRRLRALQQELESLHRTTARVLAESEQLIGQLEDPVIDPIRSKARAAVTRQRKRVRAPLGPAAKRPK